jgi:hypothetical protein
MAVETPLPTQTVWMLRSAKFRDHAGAVQYAKQFDDHEMPVEIAQRALRRNVVVPLSDPRRANLKGARGGLPSIRARPISSILTMRRPSDRRTSTP